MGILNDELWQTFDVRIRYRSIYERIKLKKEYFGIYKDIMYHRESSRVEGFIIILILVDRVDLFVFGILN